MSRVLAATVAIAALLSAGSAIAAEKSVKAVKAVKAAPVVAPVVVVGSGGFYSNLVNPSWGYCPQFVYSTALAFGGGGPLCGDP